MKIIERLENLFAAVAFAEEGDAETAKRIVRENRAETKSSETCEHCDGAEPAKA